MKFPGNFLVASGDNNNYVVKVSDFGLSRVLNEENNYYTSENSQLPVKVRNREKSGFSCFFSGQRLKV